MPAGGVRAGEETREVAELPLAVEPDAKTSSGNANASGADSGAENICGFAYIRYPITRNTPTAIAIAVGYLILPWYHARLAMLKSDVKHRVSDTVVKHSVFDKMCAHAMMNSMRNIQISVDEYYHVYNRGAHKRTIFHDTADFARFLFLILFFQSPLVFDQVSRPVRHFIKHSVFDIDDADISRIIDDRYVELISFCLMPNHFHLVLREVQEHGIARYMQRVLNGYTKYYNAKHGTSGHLFEGPYKAVHIESNEQLLYLSAYVHRNPRELPYWKNKEQKYEWSSYQDYIGENRWSKLLSTELILGQFKTKNEYEEFVRTSTAKMLDEELENISPEVL